MLLVEVDWPRRHYNLQTGPGGDHRIPRSTEAIDVMCAVLTSPSRRTVAPRASIETQPIWAGAGADSTSTVANGPTLCGAGGTASSPLRACLRKNDSRRGGTPWCSAASSTVVPPFKFFWTIHAFPSSEQCCRRAPGYESPETSPTSPTLGSPLTCCETVLPGTSKASIA